MRSPSPTPRPERAGAVAALTVAFMTMASALAGCGGETPTVVANAAPEHALAGPQGAVGQFVVECDFDHFGPDDPIVHPGHPGASHLHQFFGAVGVAADSRYEELIAGGTTCDQHADTAAYWAPVLLAGGGDPIHPIRSVAYYRAGPGVEPAAVVDFPAGLMLVAGDALAIEPQPLSVVAWSCGTGAERDVTPPDCAGAPSLRMLVTYPDCWNGVDLTSSDFRDPAERHAVYSTDGNCPDSHPVHIPQLQFAIDYPPVAADDLDGLALSSGDIHSGHADFWNTWHQQKLSNEVSRCIRRDLVCNVSG